MTPLNCFHLSCGILTGETIESIQSTELATLFLVAIAMEKSVLLLLEGCSTESSGQESGNRRLGSSFANHLLGAWTMVMTATIFHA